MLVWLEAQVRLVLKVAEKDDAVTVASVILY
jgi:hypothetical protein